jgi:hypothetical protein
VRRDPRTSTFEHAPARSSLAPVPAQSELRLIIAATPVVVIPVDHRGLMAGAHAAMVEAFRQGKTVIPFLLPQADPLKLPLELRALSGLTVDEDEQKGIPELLARRGIPAAWIARFEESTPAPAPVPVHADVLLSFTKDLEPRAKELAARLRAAGKEVTLADGDTSDSARKIEGARVTWLLAGPEGVNETVENMAILHSVESRSESAIPVLAGADRASLSLAVRALVSADLDDPAAWPRLMRTLEP